MKKTLLFICFALMATIAMAGGKKNTKEASTSQSGRLTVQVQNHSEHEEYQDSVLVVFDRYDRTEPGVVVKKLAAKENGSLQLNDLPTGKYFVTLYYFGIHKEKHEAVITIRHNRIVKWKLRLQPNEIYRRGEVVIKPTKFSMTRLSVCSMN